MSGIRTPFYIRNLSDVPTPCHILDLDRLDWNLKRVKRLKDLSNCKILLAAKGFSAPEFFEYMRGYIDGISASGLYEAKMGREFLGGYIQTYSPAFQEKNIEEISKKSNAIVFNSENQLNAFSRIAKSNGCSCGIRINPMYSRIVKDDANPCKKHSRLGIPVNILSKEMLQQVEGIHIHMMCEQHADAIEEVVEYIINALGKMIDDVGCIKWINLGGGQLIGHKDYDLNRAAKAINKLHDRFDVDVILEPCEGIVLETGYLATTVCDIIENEALTAILDSSPICHLSDAVFRGWTRDVCGESIGDEGYHYYLSGPTCFAGDTYGEYVFVDPLKVGDILFFKDTAAYSRVKNNMFNGVPFPTVCKYTKKDGIKIVKTYNYDLYKECL